MLGSILFQRHHSIEVHRLIGEGEEGLKLKELKERGGTLNRSSICFFVGFLGYLHFIKGMPASELDETVFDNRDFIEGYLDYLRVSSLSLSLCDLYQ